MVDKVIVEALKWVGYLEKKSNAYLDDYTKNAGYNNYTIFAKKYNEMYGENYQGQPWCAMYVTDVLAFALGKNTQERLMPHFAYCPTGVNWFKKQGLWHTNKPQRGDIIFFKDSSGIACHVGIIYQVSGSVIYTVEGNTSSSSGVIANGGGVFKKQYSVGYSRILGFGRPQYIKAIDENAWREDALKKLINRGYISDRGIWQEFAAPVLKCNAIALIDKVTGGTWESEEADSNIHWVQPYVISLCGKKIVTDKEIWLNFPEAPISKALTLALVDQATGGILERYKGMPNDHWARNNLNSLCDKNIIHSPQEWCDDFEGQVRTDNFMALICKAFDL